MYPGDCGVQQGLTVVIDRQQARRNQCREDTDKAQKEGAGDLIEIDL